MRIPRILTDWIVIAALASGIALGLSLTAIGERADNLIYDQLISLRAPPPADQIIIIAIDNPSLQVLGKWPWPRSTHAQLLHQLAQAHPKAVAYDVLFTEPAADDAALAAAMREAAPVYLPLLIDDAGRSDASQQAVEPVALLRAAAAGVGHVNVHFDKDGLVRRADQAFNAGGQVWPHMMTLLTKRAASDQPVPIAFQPQIGAFRTASFVDVMKGQMPAVFFKDKLVLIGATGDGMGDQFPVPLRGGGLMTGVDLQANMLNTLMSGGRIHLVSRLWVAIGALMPLWILLLGFWRWRPRTALWMSGALLIGYALGCAMLFAATGWWMPPTASAVAIIFAYPLWGWRRLSAISASLEQELGGVDEPHHTRFAPVDAVSTQTEAIHAALQQGRDIQSHAKQREEALQMLSHDMRAPQASIISLLESEGKNVAPGLANRLTGYARRTLALADNFVQIARINETAFAPQEVNLGDVLNEAVDELYPLYAARHIHVSTSGLEEPQYILGEPGLLFRVLLNLLDNAVKYSADGGHIRCDMMFDGTHVRCSIADEGIGMSEAQVEMLFQRFGAVGGKRNAGSSGSGLGLTLVKSALERHGGTVSCTSALGKGTTFMLRFPSADDV